MVKNIIKLGINDVTPNIFLLVFIFVSIIYFTDIVFNKQSLTKRYKFQISSLIFLILFLMIGLKGTIGSDYGSYYLDYIYVKEYYEGKFCIQNPITRSCIRILGKFCRFI